MSLDPYREANRANWNDRVPIHWQPDGYDAPGFIADPHRLTTVVRLDRDLLGDVTGKRLLHLQCHFGEDTLAWARLGADVTGIDFSDAAIEAAHRLSAESGTPGRFVLTELYDTPQALAGEQFDIVYTGVGAINWLPDIAAWGGVVDTMLAPGGTFLMREGHPVLWTLEWPAESDGILRIDYPYFEVSEPVTIDEETTYLGAGTLEHTTTHEWNHGIGEIMHALTSRGLVIDHFEEHRQLLWQGHPEMVQIGPGSLWEFPEPLRDRVPVMYSLRAIKRS